MSGLYMTLVHGALVPGCRTCKQPLINMVCTRCGPRVVGNKPTCNHDWEDGGMMSQCKLCGVVLQSLCEDRTCDDCGFHSCGCARWQDTVCKTCGCHHCDCKQDVQLAVASQPEPGRPSADDFERARELGWIWQELKLPTPRELWYLKHQSVTLYRGPQHAWLLSVRGRTTHNVNFRIAIEWVAHTLSGRTELSYPAFAYAYDPRQPQSTTKRPSQASWGLQHRDRLARRRGL